MGKKLVAVWVTLGVVIFATVYLVTFQEKLRLDLDRVAHIRETLSLIYDLENHLADAESAARGYILTKDEQQLERYQATVKEIDPAFAVLYQVTADEAGASRLLDELKPLIEKRRALFQKSIDLAQQTEGEKERQAVAREGARLQARIRKSLENLEDRENKLLNPQWAKEKRKTRIIFMGPLRRHLRQFFSSGLAHLSPQSGDWRPQKGGKPGGRLPGQPAVSGLLPVPG